MNKQVPKAYPYSYLFEGTWKTLLWITAEEDGSDRFAISKNRQLYHASDIENAKAAFKTLSLEIIWAEAAEMDFDEFWLQLKRLVSDESTIKYDVILDGWNFIEDILRTFELVELNRKLRNPIDDSAYQKIFAGSNIEAFKSRDDQYVPSWSDEERAAVVADLEYVWIEIGKIIEELW